MRTVVNDLGSHEADTGMAVGTVVPVEELLAVGAGILNADVGPAVGLGHICPS